MEPTRTPLNANKSLQDLLSMYKTDEVNKTFNAIILGQIGSGKTSMLATCPKPVLIDSFDPGGHKLKTLQPYIEKGEIVPDSRWEKPTKQMFTEWEKEMQRRVDSKFFDGVGTYCIDSATTFLGAMKERAMEKSGRDNVSQPEWGVIGNAFIHWVKVATSLPCNFIMTGHLVLELEESEGKTIARFNSIPSMQVNIPALFDEIYVLVQDQKGGTIERRLLTQSTAKYIARTRIGAGVLDIYEPPDIGKLLVKAGYPNNSKT
jgi:hypothetical protein